MRKIPPSRVTPSHRDFVVLEKTAEEVIRHAGSLYRLREELPILIRRAINEVIDTPRTGRLAIGELEKTEKTYIGTKIEILLRDFLGLPKGHLDLEINGVDVDIKNTVGNNWMIPSEAVCKPCILVACDEDNALCYLGVIVARPEYLTVGVNRDAKHSISASGFENIRWIFREQPYPRNLLAQMDPKKARYVTDMSNTSGNERLRRLFSEALSVPISREVVQGVARQLDYMKRLRRNGGVRDLLFKSGIVLLSGKYDANLIAALGLPRCNPDQFISMKIEKEDQKNILKKFGYL